ncbi:glycosyltransferase family 2 protein [Mycoplasma sp. P36-A1]|uniref:glycosyltransferase family 2 protein n=1 Tax=Mycoplasma sp. P36-A1 TaxID=3252900 RepID=UPI003C2FC8D4
MKMVSIIIPSYNEEGNIKKMYSELEDKLDKSKVTFEYLFVNDGSKDKTVKIIEDLSKVDKKVKLVNFSRNFGKDSAMIAGLDFCLGDAAIVIDADLQMPVSSINELVFHWLNGEKLVLTYRSNRSGGIKSKLATKYYDLFNKMSKTKIHKDAMDFQIMDREIIDIITGMREKTRYFKGMTGYLGYSPRIIPVEIVDRNAGVSKFGNIERLFSYAFESFALYSNVPLLVSIKIGAFVSLASFLFLLYVVIKTIAFGVDVDGYASLISVMLFMFGIVIMLMGVMGYYIGLIYTEVKDRPLYIVDEDNSILDYNKQDFNEKVKEVENDK